MFTLIPELLRSEFATQECLHTQIYSMPLIVLPKEWSNCLELGPLTQLSTSCPCHQKMQMSCSRQLPLDGTLVIDGTLVLVLVDKC